MIKTMEYLKRLEKKRNKESIKETRMPSLRERERRRITGEENKIKRLI